MDFSSLILGLFVGAILGIILSKFLLSQSSQKAEEKIEPLQKEVSDLREAKARLETENTNLNSREEEVKNSIEVYANQLLKKTAEELQTKQETELGNIVEPLNKALSDFKEKLEAERKEDIQERTTLKGELKNLLELNQALSEDAKDLTTALKGDQKTQGNWGELKLRKVLEASGLTQGEEFTEQGKGLGLKDEEGKLQQPDFIVNLPDDKHLIIDSKISLVGYEKYVNAKTDEERALHLRAHLKSVKDHIDGLSRKHYYANNDLSSPEFVFMFMGIEPALILAVREDHSLGAYAWEKKIILVSPSLMLASLKSVASVWKHEKQTKNALEIARQAGGLYDKFVLFLEELQGVGKKIDDAKVSYEEAFQKLKTGKGALIGRVERIRTLGAKTKRQIDKRLLEEADTEEIMLETPDAQE